MLFKLEREKISNCVAKLQIKYCEFFKENTTKIVSLIEKENCDVFYFDSSHEELKNDEIRGKIEQKGQENGIKKYNIFIRENDENELQRFVLAHELGHLLLGHNGTRYFTVKKQDLSFWNDDMCELEANLFAISVLMKDDLFRTAYSTTQDIKELSRIFIVPEKAVCMKIDFLGL